MNEIKITNRFGKTIFVHNYNGSIHLVVDRVIYTWNPDATGYVGAIEHGGNFLEGTEYRRPAQGGGDWQALVVPTHSDGSHICTQQLYCRMNDIPDIDEATKLIESGQVKNRFGVRWRGECRNSEPGRNDEWIPAGYITTAKAAELLGASLRRVQQRIKSGELPAISSGRDWLIDPDDLQKLPPPQKRGPKPKNA